MSPTAGALLGYVGWHLLLLTWLVGWRAALVLGGRRANDFVPTGEDVSPLASRLCRAHANSYEFFPIFGGLLLYALATGQTGVTDGLAWIALGGRVGQSIAHLVSTRPRVVIVRFTFLVVQIGCAGWWTYGLVASLA